jgi:competence protein ComEA
MLFSKFSGGQVQARLAKLISPRSKNADPFVHGDFPANLANQTLLNPPVDSLNPLIKIFVVALFALVGLWWLNKPAEISNVETLNSNSVGTQSNQIGQIVVHVTGEVRNPGIVTLPAGSRVMDAITAAGGFVSDVSAVNLNLAAHIEDGQLIYVGQDTGPSADTRINLNTATLTDLEALPGVGPVMAQRILQWRTTNNRFSSVEELQEIDGIGPKLFSRLRELVRV